jgi:short-subunit dehydrogenase
MQKPGAIRMPHTPSTVVITGATAGVGRATARHFAQRGYRLALIARSEQGLSETASELEAMGAQVIRCSVDVSDAKAMEQAAERVESELGPIDIWINAAMNTVIAPVHETTSDEYKRISDVTYLGAVNGTLCALKYMRARDHGTIVQVGSALAYRSIPLQSAYCAAKSALRGFTDSLRSELIHDGSHVRLSMVHLPGLNTPQFDWARNKMGNRPQPVAPIYQPETAARAIYDASQRAPREIWLGASTLQSILGQHLAPALLDRLMARQAYEGQTTTEPEPEDRADYVDTPVDGTHRCHGRFDADAKARAISIDGTTVMPAVLVGVGALCWLAGRILRR